MRTPIWIRLSPRFAVEAREAIQDHLAALFAPEPETPENDEASHGDDLPPEPLPVDPTSSSPIPLPTTLSEAQHEELTTDNVARHDWIAEGGKQERDVHGRYPRTADFRISTTDPDATPMRWQREVEPTWATTRTTWWMEANVASS